ncbi:adenylate/guanylate cyclase domain-containing protein [Shimia sp. W99]
MCAGITQSAELGPIVERWLRAYARGDKETVVNLLSDDPALSYVGSADNEIWRGAALKRTLPHYMDEIPRFDWSSTEFRGFSCGDIGWVEWHGDTFARDTGKSIKFRSVFVLALEKGVWRIVLVMNSNPVANMQALGYEAEGFEDLVDAALSAPADLAQTGIATIMFTDIADSTAIAQTIGDARWTAAVNAHVDQVSRIISDHGGTLIKTLGDGTMASFSSSRAGLLAATGLQQAMQASTSEPKLQIRIGLHTGDLVERDGDMFGTVVNKAARIAALAAPGSILLSDATRIMVGGASEFSFGPSTSVALKGLEGDHTLYQLDWQA